jgi:hypothetical protein
MAPSYSTDATPTSSSTYGSISARTRRFNTRPIEATGYKGPSTASSSTHATLKPTATAVKCTAEDIQKASHRWYPKHLDQGLLNPLDGSPRPVSDYAASPAKTAAVNFALYTAGLGAALHGAQEVMKHIGKLGFKETLSPWVSLSTAAITAVPLAIYSGIQQSRANWKALYHVQRYGSTVSQQQADAQDWQNT